jgi:thymidylate kinase
MRKEITKGKLVVFEGVSGVGKTTTLRETMMILETDNVVYNKGFVKDSVWHYLINTYPHSFTYYMDLIVQTGARIIPQLSRGQNVLQDRYYQTVDSFFPDCEWPHNEMFRKMFTPLFVKPDVYIHVKADLDVVTQRLSKFVEDEYRSSLVAHPERQVRREEKYMQIYDGMTCPKYILDTTGKKPQECADELIEILRRERIC